jgi:hypothetical protein
MRYFVQVGRMKKILEEDKVGFSDLGSARARAALIASDWIVRYPHQAPCRKEKPVTVDVVNHEGRQVVSLPVNPAYT